MTRRRMRRPAELAAAGGAGAGTIIVGVLHELTGWEPGPYTTVATLWLVGLIPGAVTWWRTRRHP